MHWLARTAVTAALSAVMVLSATPSYAETSLVGSPSVLDKAELFTPAEKSTLENQIKVDNKEYGLQYVVETVPSIEGDEPIEDYAARRAEELGIDAGEANGVYILLNQANRLVRFELGDKVDRVVSITSTSQVLDNIVLPELKEDRYLKGVSLGMEAIGDLYTTPPPGSYGEDNQIRETIPDLLVPLSVAAVVLALIILALMRLQSRLKDKREAAHMALVAERKKQVQKVLDELGEDEKEHVRFQKAANARKRKDILSPKWDSYLSGDSDYKSGWYKDFIASYLSHYQNEWLAAKRVQVPASSLTSAVDDEESTSIIQMKVAFEELYSAELKSIKHLKNIQRREAIKAWFYELGQRIKGKQEKGK